MSNELAPPVAKSCSGRGNILWQACECLAAGAKRRPFPALLLLQWEVMIGRAVFHLPQCGMLSEAEPVEIALGGMVFQP